MAHTSTEHEQECTEQQPDASPAGLVALGGMLGLVLAMGIGRFAYTALLPLMQQTYGFGPTVAGGLAAANYAGYLVGALLCMLVPRGPQRLGLFRGSLVISVSTTAAMGLSDVVAVWWVLRALAGVASAGVMVLGSAIALDRLAQVGVGSWRGLIFSGIGVGIGLSGLVVLALDWLLPVHGLWQALGVFSLPLAVASWVWLRTDQTGRQPQTPTPSWRALLDLPPLLPWLAAAYFCVGLGYIVSGTFLVAIVQSNTASSLAGTTTWIVVGVAAAGSTLVWPMLATRVGAIPALVAAHGLQALGILLPALSPGLGVAYVGALLFGGTFMGIVGLTMSLGQQLAPQQSTRVLALLTATYGTGQMIGPLLAGSLAEYTHSFTLPLVGAAGVVAGGSGLLLIGAGHARR